MDDWKIERRFSVGWKPRLRGRSRDDDSGFFELGDVGGDELGPLVIIPLVIAVVVLLIVAAPLVLFVLELTLVLAIVVPLAAIALIVGLRRHELVARNERTGAQVRRHVRGVVSSVRVKRRWKREILEHGHPSSAGAAVLPGGPERRER